MTLAWEQRHEVDQLLLAFRRSLLGGAGHPVDRGLGDRLPLSAGAVLSRFQPLLEASGLSLTLYDSLGEPVWQSGRSPDPVENLPREVPSSGPVGVLDLGERLLVAAAVCTPDPPAAVGLLELRGVAPSGGHLAGMFLTALAQTLEARLMLPEPTAAGRRAARGGSQAVTPGLVGKNPRWLAALDRAARAARTDSTVLITGETGTGKEVLARAVHRASSRASGPFLAVNCGALPATLAASELFGYVGGAFTGANPRGSTGKVEAANGGTLFLDEVSELSPEGQVSLLRILQEREVVRVGSHQVTSVNVRVIAATNRSLEELVQAGAFRQDLFFRLNVVPIHIPPLRERREDILPLVEYAYRRLNIEPPELGFSSCERLTAHGWPGNVRELLNLVEQAVALDEDPADLLPLPPLPTPAAHFPGDPGEEEQIRLALEECGGNAAAAARSLGMGRSTLYRKLEFYGIRLKRQVE